MRSAEPDDAAAMLDCAREVFRTSPYLLTSPDEFTLTEEQEREFIAGMLSHPRQLLLVAVSGERVVGILDLRQTIPRRKARHRVLLGMSVREAYRGAGVGTALMERALGWAKAHPDLALVTLEVYAENVRAVALYRRFGFVEKGTLPGGLIHDDGSAWDQVEMFLRV
ncbi:MAG: acetyltransferase [Phycisphaerae bacterium]|nr:MAG: acetyltransferase [Phycisphaerae bacterium]